MRFNDFMVKFQEVDNKDRVVTKEKSFKSEKLRSDFLDKLDDKGRLVQVLAFSDPQ